MPPTAPSRLLVIRHGQSTWNAERRWQGTEDPSLSELGERQARHAARFLGTFDAIVSSPLRRAHTTAEILGEALGIGPVRVEPGLRERHAGEFQGLTRDEIEQRHPGMLESGRRPPGWEPDEQVIERAAAALGRVAASVGAGGTALVVAHGGVLRQLEELAGARREERLANLAGRWFRVGPDTLVADEPVVLADPDELTVPGQL